MNNRKIGFTLIEMLVVIAIISILASMLAPGLMKARNTAQTVVCKNNLKQIGTAGALYANDFMGYYLPHKNGTLRWNSSPYLRGVLGAHSIVRADNITNRYPPAMLCPKAANTTGANKDGVPLERAYGINIADCITTYHNYEFISYYPSRIRSPGRLLIIADALDHMISGSSTLSDYISVGEKYKSCAAAYRHPGYSLNIVFADGHVKKKFWIEMVDDNSIWKLPVNNKSGFVQKNP